MIAKKKQTPPPNDKREKAGYQAETQMAFYLRRVFGESPDVYVFNDLRLQRNSEVAQIDHLILHRYGFVIVESKSVVEKITVNARGEFARYFNGTPRGMPSPIQQARLQADLLMRLLNDHKEQLRRKVLFGLQQGLFRDERFRVLVAISDSGIIRREECDPPELCKADSIAEKVQEFIAAHERMAGVSGFVRFMSAGPKGSAEMEKDVLGAFTTEEQTNLVQFLLERHTPVAMPSIAATPSAKPSQTPPPTMPGEQVTAAPSNDNTYHCRHCHNPNVVILHGRYGYYFRCQDCQGNTPIDKTCQNCGGTARIKKSRLEFHKVCEACASEVLFYTNPAS